MKIVLLGEAQERFQAEDRWWREHRDAKELFVTEFQRDAPRSSRKRASGLLPHRLDRLADEEVGIGARPRPEFLRLGVTDGSQVQIALRVYADAMGAPERARIVAQSAPLRNQVAVQCLTVIGELENGVAIVVQRGEALNYDTDGSGKNGVDFLWENCLVVADDNGNITERSG